MTSPLRLTRRQVLAGGASMALLAACGDDGSSTSAADTDELSVVRFFGPYFAAGAVARVPFGLSDNAGILPLEETPEKVVVASITAPDGTVVVEDITVPRYGQGLPRPYFAFEATPPVAGFYDMVLDVDGAEVISQFQVVAADSPALAERVDPGEPFPVVETPTPAADRGVTPICTREPGCDLHSHSLDQLLGKGPVVLLIATPAFCQSAVCGPVLDVTLGVVPDHPEISFVHAEVYSNPFENEGSFSEEDFAPIIGEAGVPYEPVLYTIDAAGAVVDRIDYIFAEEEVRSVVETLSGLS